MDSVCIGLTSSNRVTFTEEYTGTVSAPLGSVTRFVTIENFAHSGFQAHMTVAIVSADTGYVVDQVF